MKKLSIIALVIGTAAATGFFITKMLQKKKSCNDYLNDDYDDDCCDCESCSCDAELDVVIPDEDDDSAVVTPADACCDCSEEEKCEDANKDAAEEKKED